jgi:type I restriction enzyme S subunit
MEPHKDWFPAKLGDLVLIKHGWPFKSEYMAEDDAERPVVVGIGNFEYSGGFRFQSTAIKIYTGDYPKEFVLKPGDILLVMTCQTAGGEILGIPGRIPGDGRIYLHNQRMGKVIIKNKKEVDINFLYHLFLTFEFNRHLVATATGTKILHTAPERIASFNFLLPPLSTQRTIANILAAYDDLIENNLQRITILEETAQMLYHEWFVNFHFPGHEQVKMVESELGRIPEEWEVKKLGALSAITMGQSPSSQYYNDKKEGLPFHQGVTDFGRYFPSDRIYCTTENRIAGSGDILFSVRAPVGRINIADKRIIIGRGLAAIRSTTGNQTFLFWQLKELFQKEDLIGNGSIFKSVTKEDVHSINILRPPDSIITQFEGIALDIITKIKNTSGKTIELRQARDQLLPKLISGQIDVSSWAEESAEEVAQELAERVSDGVGTTVYEASMPIRKVVEARTSVVEPIERNGLEWHSLWDGGE